MRLLLALDLRTEDLWHLEEATAWAARLGATLDLVWVDPFGDYGVSVLDPRLASQIEQGLEQARQRDHEAIEALLRRIPEAHRGTAQVRAGDPASEVVALAATYDALLVSTHGRRGVMRMWLGSVAERIVRSHTGTTIVLRRES